MEISKPDKQLLKEMDKRLTLELERLRPSVLEKAEQIMNKQVSIHNFHGMIGGKNNEYADCIHNQFMSPDEFINEWLKGFIKAKGNDIANGGHPLFHILKDPDIKKYVFTFLERNFYRQIEARTRAKPGESFWSCWFGNNNLYWGLLIAPVKRNNIWTNDVSEIRRANFSYWTFGHVMNTGLVDLENDELFRFDNIDEFYKFIINILKRLSSSEYEKEIYRKYVEYLKNSKNIMQEPFLIPELRYAGMEKEHKYRLDFTVLNSHVMKFIGFEFSPQSTHMVVKGIKSGRQSMWNDDLKKQWGKEMKKRNAYFSSYGITTITFTDDELEDLDNCFNEIKRNLEERPKIRTTVNEQLDIIYNMKF